MSKTFQIVPTPPDRRQLTGEDVELRIDYGRHVTVIALSLAEADDLHRTLAARGTDPASAEGSQPGWAQRLGVLLNQARAEADLAHRRGQRRSEHHWRCLARLVHAATATGAADMQVHCAATGIHEALRRLHATVAPDTPTGTGTDGAR